MKSHWTPRYVADRIRLARWQRRHPGEPWIAPGAAGFLGDWIRPSDVVVEFGSGRSTLWFAGHARHIISVEHHAGWHEKVSNDIRERGMRNVSYHLVDEAPDPAHPGDNNRRLNPDRFTGAAEESLRSVAADGRADVVVVDGANRDTTAIWAIDHVRPGGAIIVDNCNRFLPSGTRSPASIPADGKPLSALWVEFAERTAGWRRAWFSDGVADTLFVFAPVG